MYINNQNTPPVPPYEYQEYPKWVGDRIVQNAAEEEALLAAQDPAGDAALRNADTVDQRAALMQAAVDKGIKIDKRWSDDKLRAAIEAAQ
jgi:hypothetical protein